MWQNTASDTRGCIGIFRWRVITVDAIKGREFNGKVTAIASATGSKYSLVPTDNSAGNFVKIQQRIPVRIDFTGLSPEDNDKFAAGMMVVVKAKL